MLILSNKFISQIAINTNGNNPDNSAALDIDFNNKGLLIPRVSLSSNTDASTINNPATSLLVYNTNATMTGGQGKGYYYNAGTSTSPNWVKLLSGNEGWLITGNIGTDPTINFLGTKDAQDLVIRTNNAERLRVTTTGYVGINTSSPAAFLDIQTPNSGGPFLGARIYNNRAATGNYALELNVASTALTNKILVLKAGGTEYASFRGNGRVIIGNTTDDPNTLLDIVGGASGTTTRLFTVRSNYYTNNTGTSIALINSSSPSSDVGATITSILNNASNGYSDLYFSVHGGGVYGALLERMRLTGRGDLGLGTSTPGVSTQTGRNYLTISGYTGAGILELITREADNDNVRVGGIQFVDINATGEKRVAFIGSNLSGTTANNRGGNIDFWTKSNNGSLSQAMVITNTGRVGINTTNPLFRLHVIESSAGTIAIRGENTATTGTSIGVRGQTSSNDGFGVVGYNSSTSAPTTFPQAAGVFGQTDAPNSIGVWGLANNSSTNQSIGVWGETRGANSIGVVGTGNGLTSGTLPSVGAGGYFRGQTYGVYTFSSGGSATYALYAVNTGNNGNGVFCEASVGTGAWAIWARSTTGYAGYFSGNVNVTGSLSKGSGSFLIDHPLDPLNKTLRHNFVESPENLCLYRGKVKLDENGQAIVKMPDYFVALTKETEATVILTPIGKVPFLTSYEWNEDYTFFYIYGQPNREVSYQVLADRDDPVMRMLYKPVEEEKGNGNFEKGYLIYPKAYGYPESMGYEMLKLQQKNDNVNNN